MGVLLMPSHDLGSIDISSLTPPHCHKHWSRSLLLEDVVADALSGFDGIAVLWRKRLQDALHQLNAATLQLQAVLENYRCCAIPSGRDYASFRKALRAETEARLEYMRVAMAVQDLVLHGRIPSDSDPKAIVMNSGSR
jgi:hypothetical protein